MTVQNDFLLKASAAARQAGHVWPEFAACEAALESGWGGSRLAAEANNLFGQKQSHPPVAGSKTLGLPTREFLHGTWMTVAASWVEFSDWQRCFTARMELLRRLSGAFPHYAAALAAKSGEEFVVEVSRSWSTDPERAGKVLAIHDTHREAFGG